MGITINVEKREGKDLGIDVDFSDRQTFRLVRIKQGVLQDWNHSHPSKQVRKDDRILAVNGIRGTTEKILSEVRRTSTYELVIQRCDEFRIQVKKDSSTDSIGLDIDKTSLKVINLKQGPVLACNATVMQEFQAKPGQRIVQVNGFTDIAGIIGQLR